jgi:hypothetical protein
MAEGCVISPVAVFVPADAHGVTRPVEIGADCQVGPFDIIHRGAHQHRPKDSEEGRGCYVPDHR